MRNSIVPDDVACDARSLALRRDLEAIYDERLFVRSGGVVDGE